MMKFQVDKEKTVEALVYVTARAGAVSRFYAGKILYFADVDHLRKYGRPVTGDVYIAMENGPVPSHAYDIIRGKVVGPEKDSVDASLERIQSHQPTVRAKRDPNLSYFSKTDMECLDHAIEHCLGLSFGQLSDETHGHHAWKNASLNDQMSFDDMLVDADPDVIEDARTFAAYGVL